MGTPANPTAPANGKPELASQYDVIDPEFTYTIPDNIVSPPVIPASAQPTQVQPVTGSQAPSSSPQPASSAPVSQQKHPTWLLSHAAEFGFHPRLIEVLDTPELTQLVMESMKSQREPSRQVAAAATQTQANQPNPAAVPVNSVGQPAAQSQWDWGIHDDTDEMGRPVKKQFTDADIHPAPSAPVSQQKHPTWLLSHAAEFGFHPRLIEVLDTPELTQLVMDSMKSQREPSRQVAAAATPTQTSQANQSNPAAVPVNSVGQPAAQSPWDWGIHDDTDEMGRPVKKQFTDADIHPALSTHIKSLTQRISTLEATVKRYEDSAAAATQSTIQNQFDSAFNKIGGIFGTGSGKSLQGKPEFERRATVYAAVKGMFSSLPQNVASTMTIEQAVFTMAKSLFQVDAAASAAAASGTQPTPEQFRNGGLQPPTQRRGSDKQPGRDRAIEDAQGWWKEQVANGGMPDNGGTSMEEFLPV